MNYLNELRAFYDWIETHSLTSSDIALWHALMAIANKTGWRDDFSASVSVLGTKAGLNKKAVERSRNRLVQEGLVKWKKRSGNQSAAYTMISLWDKLRVEYDPQNVPQPVPQSVPQDDPQPVPQSVPINKQDKTKHGKKRDTNVSPKKSGVFEAYAGDDEDLLAALKSFEAMRRQSKKPMTDRARGLLLTELDKLAGDNATKTALLDQSVLHGWLGVYPLKNSAQPIKPQGGGNPFLEMLREEERRG